MIANSKNLILNFLHVIHRLSSEAYTPVWGWLCFVSGVTKVQKSEKRSRGFFPWGWFVLPILSRLLKQYVCCPVPFWKKRELWLILFWSLKQWKCRNWSHTVKDKWVKPRSWILVLFLCMACFLQQSPVEPSEEEKDAFSCISKPILLLQTPRLKQSVFQLLAQLKRWKAHIPPATGFSLSFPHL